MRFSPSCLSRRARLSAGVVPLVLACGGVALAFSPYTVHVKVPSSIKKGTQYKVTAKGESANLSILTVYLAGKPCAANASREQGVSGAKRIIKADVVNKYSKSATEKAKVLGTHHACAYLTGTPPQSLPRAHSFATYSVVT